MITVYQYFGQKDHTQEHMDNATLLLSRVEALIVDACDDGAFVREIDADTGTCISGSKGGAGDGGFRLSNSTTGAPTSSHKEARAVDVYDPKNALDTWLDSFEDGNGGNLMLEQHKLYREASKHTPGWCHLTTRAPGSGRRSFNI
jgi:hypothetical protein